jgi:hypothetical protein
MRGAPQVWILSQHTEDQGANLFADRLPSSYLAHSGDPRPIQTKSRSMPVHDGSKTSGCLHPDQHSLKATQNSLCRAVNRRRGRCACRVSNCRRRGRFSRTRSAPQLKEPTNQPTEEMPERHDHGKNFSGKDRVKLCAKSLISQVYDLLARHTGYRTGPVRASERH